MVAKPPFWAKIPFLRLLLPLVIGILVQWKFQFPLVMIYSAGAVALTVFAITHFYSVNLLFRFGWINGIVSNLLFISLGVLLTHNKDVRNDRRYFAKFYSDSSTIQATVLEPPLEKEISFKAIAEVHLVLTGRRVYETSGRIIIYFKKDAAVRRIHFGSSIVFNKFLQEIRNSGNPGAFDYKQYCLFNGITHQVYLTDKDYGIVQLAPGISWLDRFLVAARERTVLILRKFITSKKELGLAEALLINYKDDLDKTLLQSYTNTGVVHIIAISGQHLALIYWLLVQILSPLKRTKALRLVTTFMILSILWLFSLMTGAQPSIIRAALMCTLILLAEVLTRRSNTLNSLACSAFVLLCINPFDLWDVGFQLSFAGLLSLVLFTRPIYKLVSVQNSLLRHVWNLVSASIAAQILTTPISIYHFHQFPFSFLLTNLLAVPLSSLVLTLELVLFAISFIAPVAMVTGKLLSVLIWLMNTWVERIEGMQWLLWDGLQITASQTLLLYVSILGLALWLLKEVKQGARIGIAGVILFMTIRSFSFLQAREQRRLIVYNVPKHAAIDLVYGRKFCFIGDEELMRDGILKNFNIKPARTLFRMQSIKRIGGEDIAFTWYGKRIVIAIDERAVDGEQIDVLVLLNPIQISFDPRLIKMVVIGSSIPQWKSKQLEEQLTIKGIPFHDVAVDGAYILEPGRSGHNDTTETTTNTRLWP